MYIEYYAMTSEFMIGYISKIEMSDHHAGHCASKELHCCDPPLDNLNCFKMKVLDLLVRDRDYGTWGSIQETNLLQFVQWQHDPCVKGQHIRVCRPYGAWSDSFSVSDTRWIEGCGPDVFDPVAHAIERVSSIDLCVLD
jgi:hypothetical protein